jgi:hypothetical protein
MALVVVRRPQHQEERHQDHGDRSPARIRWVEKVGSFASLDGKGFNVRVKTTK